MFRNILLAIPERSLGAPQALAILPSQVWRTRLTAWLFAPLRSLFLYIRAGMGANCCRQSKSFLSVDFAWGLTYFRLPRIIIIQGRQRRVSVKR